MFINRRNVDQYVQTKPRPSLPQSTHCSSAVYVPPFIEHPSTSSNFTAAATGATSTTNGRRALPQTAFRTRKASHRSLSPLDYRSDSEEIEVEEVFDMPPPRPSSVEKGVRCSTSVAYTRTSGAGHMTLSRPRSDAASSRTQASEGKNGAARSTVTAANVLQRRYPAHRDAVVLGDLSPLSRVSPGESRLSDGFVLRRGRGSSAEQEPETLPDDNASENVEEKESLLSASQAKVERKTTNTEKGTQSCDEEDVGDTRDSQHQRHPVHSVAHGSPTSVHGDIASQRPSTSPSEHVPQRSSQQRAVSDLERTLVAATKALTAAAAREAQRRTAEAVATAAAGEAEAVRAAAIVTVPSLEVRHVHDVLLSTALKEKVLLFEAYLAGQQSTTEAMERCAALYRRDAERSIREAEGALQAQEKATQHRVALYRQHMSTEAARVAAESHRDEERSAVEGRVAEMTRRVSEMLERVAAQEVAVQEQQKLHGAEALQWRQAAHASALELRALQSAHEHATERWMALQVSYAALRDSYEVLRRRRTKAQRPRDVNYHASMDCFDVAKSSSRILRRDDTVLSPTRTEGVTVKKVDNTEADAFHPAGMTRESVAAGGADITDASTALEALLARTTSDSGLLTPPLTSRTPTTVQESEATRVRLVPPLRPTQGCLSSPPGTPLHTADDARMFASTEEDQEVDEEKANAATGVDHSPDAKPVQQAVSFGDGGIGGAVESDSGATHLRSGSTRRTSSSMRPSRLNSVASTRRGSSPSLLQIPSVAAHVVQERVEVNDGPLSACNGSGVNMRTCAADTRVEEPRNFEWEESRLRATAAVVVQQELSRLLKLALASPESTTKTTQLNKNTKTTLRPTKQNASAELTLLSTPPMIRVDSDAVVSREVSSSMLLLPAMQWMRVCETAHLSAQVCSRLEEKMQRLVDSLQQRLQLLDEKDWNKTMAKRFIAVEHAAALHRLTDSVRAVLHGSAAPTSRIAASNRTM